MIVNCHKCNEPIDLSITNVLQQRIEYTIAELEKQEPKYQFQIAMINVLKDLLK